MYVKDKLRLLRSVRNNNEHVPILNAVFFSHLGCCPKITQRHLSHNDIASLKSFELVYETYSLIVVSV